MTAKGKIRPQFVWNDQRRVLWGEMAMENPQQRRTQACNIEVRLQFCIRVVHQTHSLPCKLVGWSTLLSAKRTRLPIMVEIFAQSQLIHTINQEPV